MFIIIRVFLLFFLAFFLELVENENGEVMKKKDILSLLNTFSLEKDQFMVLGDASIVCHGLKRECDKVEIASLVDFSNPDVEVHVIDCLRDYDCIDNFLFLDLKNCLEEKKKTNIINDKAIIKKIELYLETLDTYHYERELKEKGYHLIGGVDEVGRGPLVGPVVAACCILPDDFHLDGLTDSKKLSEKKREFFFQEIKKQAVSYGIGIVDERRIDEINIYEATKEAMMLAIQNCSIKPDYVLTDAMKLKIDIPVLPIIKGDLKSITISAASVLAKVTRDHMMYDLDLKYPMYDFKNNVGYPTKKHLEAIEEYGIIPEHRKSYGPVKEYLEKNEVK